MKKALLAIAAAALLIPTIATANPDELEILELRHELNQYWRVEASYENRTGKVLERVNIECAINDAYGDHLAITRFTAWEIKPGHKKYFDNLVEVEEMPDDIQYECYDNS